MPPSKTNFRIVIFSICVTGILILISVQTFRRAAYRISNDFFHPFLNFPNKIENTLSDKSLLLKSRSELAQTLERTRKEMIQLKASNTILKNLKIENDKLRKIVRLGERAGYKCVFSEIIIRDPTQWDQVFTINKGSDDGVLNGSAAMTYIKVDEEGHYELAVVGRVTAVSKHNSLVSTLVNNECRLSIFFPRSDAAGVSLGGGSTGERLWLKVGYLPKDKRYSPGDPAFTSGFSEWVAPGLYIGKVSSTPIAENRINNKLFSELRVAAAADFDSLRFIVVLVRNDK